MRGRSAALWVWYGLLMLLAVELLLYGASGCLADFCRRGEWAAFQRDVRAGGDIKDTTPYAGWIRQYARRERLNPAFVAAVIRAESNFQPRALSRAGAYGLMQIIPSTWEAVDREDGVCREWRGGACGPDCYYDPERNICVGTAYLGRLSRRFGGNLVLTAAAYNSGPQAVQTYGGPPPYRETQIYVERVIRYWYSFSGAPTPFFLRLAPLWQEARTAAARALAATAAPAAGLAYWLYRRHRGWRWR